MSEPDPTSKKRRRRRKSGKSPDPYVRAFLRRAVAIVAAERGFNESSQAKLQKLATQLGISDRAFRKAVDKLKKPGRSLGLNRYEREFVKTLTKELANIRGDVLNIKAEGKLISLANRKYQIDSVRAHQLIQIAAEQNDVATISHVDAEHFARQLVEDAVGESTSLKPIHKERLKSVCKKWGFGASQLDQLLLTLFRKNRNKRRWKWTLRVAASTLLLTMLAAAVYVGYQTDWKKNWRRLVARSSPRTSNPAPGDSNNTELSFPDWWDDQMKEQANRLVSRGTNWLTQLANLVEDSDSLSDYEQLTTDTLKSRRFDPSAEALIAGLYWQDPVEANAQAIASVIRKSLATSANEESPTSGAIRRSWRATGLLASLATNNARQVETAGQAERIEKIDRLENVVFGKDIVDNSRMGYLDDALASVVANQWSTALRFSGSQPRSVAGFLSDLESHRLSKKLELHEIRTQIVQSIITNAPVQWSPIRQSIRYAIQQSRPADLVSWYEIVTGLRHNELLGFVTECLRERLGIKPSVSRDVVIKGLRDFRAKQLNPQYELAVSTNQQLESDLRILRDGLRLAGVSWQAGRIEFSNNKQFPELIAKTARSNNLLLAWIEGNVSQSRSFQEFQTIIAGSAMHDFEPIASNFRKPSPSQVNRLRSAIERIANSTSSQVSSRITALNTIRDVAKSFDDLEHPDARKLANYLFRAKDPRESLAVDRSLRDFGHWMNLKFAVADYLAANSVSLDNAMDVVARLGVEDIELSRQSDWRQSIQEAILVHNLKRMNQTAKEAFDNSWRPIELALNQKLRKRIEIVAGYPVSWTGKFPDNWINGLRTYVGNQSSVDTNASARFGRWIELIREDAADSDRLVQATNLFREYYCQRCGCEKLSNERHLPVELPVQVLQAELRLQDQLLEIRRSVIAKWEQ